ncbi:MAG: lipid-A-disaccharide synthase [Robiginitomaculum sp.]|nr:MAG: lipid-A-disaccharide synthase [Robiginitomaculum sp.]
MTKPHVFIVAAEKSGDELGAGLVRALRQQTKNQIQLSAIGGSALAREGLISPVDISSLSILGFVEALKSYPVIMQRVAQATEVIMASGADAVVLIDSWGFMMRVARRLKKQGFNGQIIKYVAPQVWAMREGRSKVLADGVDHLLTIHDFDAPYFTRHGLNTIYVGNPVFDQAYDTGDGPGLRRQYNIGIDTPVLVMLFGSRLSEIQRLAEPFSDAVGRLKKALPELVVISPVSDTISEDVLAAAAQEKSLQDVILLEENRKLDCFAAAHAAIACSGTVTSQLASAGVPTVVGYKLNTATYLVAKRLFKPDYMSMVNIANDQLLMPEFIQNDCNGKNLADTVLPYLTDKNKRNTASQALISATKKMRRGNACGEAGNSSTRAAQAVLGILG